MFVNHSISGGATESRENSVAVSNLPSLGVVTITDEPAGNANFERRIAVKSSKVSEARSTTSAGKPDESPIRWDGCIRGKPTFGKRERDEFSKDSQPCCRRNLRLPSWAKRFERFSMPDFEVAVVGDGGKRIVVGSSNDAEKAMFALLTWLQHLQRRNLLLQ